uniref:2'-5'-oligoadenylate synthetase like n=1 Tax=Catagonus wagneri TaxID=51154 RepID=A0A8C3WRE9_9CETA
MGLMMELSHTPASKLNCFVDHCLHPRRDWKEEVLEAVKTVKKFLRQQCFQGDHEVGLCVLQVGSFGNGTVLHDTTEVELVVFLSCICSFQEAKNFDDILDQLYKNLWNCQDLLAFHLEDVRLVQGVFCAITFTIQTRMTAKPITFTIVPAYRSLVSNSEPSTKIYVDLIEAKKLPGNFSPSFSELQRNFVKHRPAKLKSLLRLVKHWYLKYVKARYPRAKLPPFYALELLTVYAWEIGTGAQERFRLDRGLVTVMCLLQEYKFLCIYWTKYYTFQNPIIEDFVRKQLKKERPIILDPADPTYNVAYGYRWDRVAQRARQCLKQDCCHHNENPVPAWYMKVMAPLWRGYLDFTIYVDPYESIKKVKEKIQIKLGSLALQRLSFQEPGGERKLLSSRHSFSHYGIFSNTQICLLETIPPPEIQVFVKNPSGGSCAYAIDPSSSILDLKQQIEDQERLLRKEQHLEFQGQVLHDECYLRSYGIRDSDTLILSKRKVERPHF